MPEKKYLCSVTIQTFHLIRKLFKSDQEIIVFFAFQKIIKTNMSFKMDNAKLLGNGLPDIDTHPQSLSLSLRLLYKMVCVLKSEVIKTTGSN